MNYFDVEARVRYADTDQMGVVYYANYFVWFEIGRTEFLRSLGLRYFDLEKSNIYLPVVESYCKFKAPARYDDLLIIRTYLGAVEKATLSFHYEIINKGDNNRLIASGYTVHAFVNDKGRPTKIPEEVKAKLINLLDRGL